MPIISMLPTGGGGGGGIPVSAVSNIQTLFSSEKIYIKWTDPNDVVLDGSTVAEWEGTLLVRKAGSTPINRRDGTVVLDNKVRNAYQNSYFCDSGLSNGVTYYYKFFSYTVANAYTDSADNEFSVMPNPVQVGDITAMSAVANGDGKLAIKWTDPDATVATDGITLATWASTKVVYKVGEYPTNPEDGTLVVNSVTRNAYSSTALNVSGLTNNTLYYITFFPISTDGNVNTNVANRITGTPNKIKITSIPSPNGTLTYTGNTQSPVWNNYDSNQMTISGITNSINAGTFNAVFTPKEDYCWPDDSTTSKTVSWTIGKAVDTLSISHMSIVLDGTNPSQVITVTRAGDGVISAVSSDVNIATVSVNGTNVTVNGVISVSGNAVVTISVAEGTNHLAPTNQTCSVATQFLPVKDTLENMHWNDISTVCKLGKASEYWSIGDKKTIHVNGIAYEAQIIGMSHDTPTDTTAYGQSKAGITMQLVNCLSDTYIMNSTSTNVGGWNASSMRTSTMPTLLGQLDETLRNAIVSVNKETGLGGGSSSGTETTSDNLFLLSGCEVAVSSKDFVSGEGGQYAWYAAGNSKKKTDSVYAYYCNWWMRSPRDGYSSAFCIVRYDGDVSTSTGNNYVSFGFCV